LFKDDAAFPLISYAELQFIKAEAAFIKGDKETAYNAFKLGIKAHMDFTGVASADQDTYMSSAAVPQTKEALTLKDILDQKYIALFMNNETWSDLRRHDYDTNLYPGYKIPEVLMPENNNSPVERLVYIQFSEFDWNIETVKKQGADQPDYHTRKLWVFTNRE
ncbi:MAG TPA: SusD/RagB family nutrient-binding outer membrane lipoprotein, partial [Chitinophagaceae bacterium]|nr:SusD/RagB family nutrient-binding outer membrane lipoprotein [Chitinophagaceae bacterium]